MIPGVRLVTLVFETSWEEGTTACPVNQRYQPVLRSGSPRIILSEKARLWAKDLPVRYQEVTTRRGIAGPVVLFLQIETLADVDAFLKPLQDALQHAGIIVDDAQIEYVVLRKLKGKRGAHKFTVSLWEEAI